VPVYQKSATGKTFRAIFLEENVVFENFVQQIPENVGERWIKGGAISIPRT
jgi:hypothetical protein